MPMENNLIKIEIPTFMKMIERGIRNEEELIKVLKNYK
jgi:hypothetical protein